MRSIKLVSINVYYSPRSFGGATIVAEEVNKHLSTTHNYDVTVITTHNNPKLHSYHLKKYKTKGVNVISINIPHKVSYTDKYKNSQVEEIINNIIQSLRPELVHVHSIQTLGASFFKGIKTLNAKIALTIHDCWWICDRQFMINSSGKYCFQEKIDPLICMYCVDYFPETDKKMAFLNQIREHVDLFLYPSAFHKDLHIKNSFPAETSKVNKNGIKMPKKGFEKTVSLKTRFGFTGGPGPIKGFDLIIEAFELIDRSDYELILVDAAQNIGKSWGQALNTTKIKGTKTVKSAYNQSTIDDFFKDIDVLLFPSQWKESFGLTVREALVRNCWIISTNGGGTVEDLVEGDNASIIPISQNAQLLADKIEECLDKDWSNYMNPHISSIQTYELQAHELDSIFKNLTLS